MAVVVGAGLVGKVTAPVLPEPGQRHAHPRHPLRHVGEDRARARRRRRPPRRRAPHGDDDSDGGASRRRRSPPPPAESTTTSSTTTTIDTTNNRDTGQLRGRGPDQLPQVDLLDDSPVFGRIVEGDIVLTAGGTESLAPPDIPVGIVRNVVNRSSAEGPLLEIETLADLDRLHFVSRRARTSRSPRSPRRSTPRRAADAGVARAGPVAAAVLRRPRSCSGSRRRCSPTCARRACRSR